MLPFPKRPPGANEYDLQTGDYVAYDASAQPSRQPLWGRQAPVSSYGNVQVAPHVRADMQRMGGSYAPPPASLAPVAMSAHAAGTGSYPAATVVVRGRPDMRWGVTLAIAGALLGGVLGVTMNNGKHRAALAEAPPLMVAAAQPVQAPAPPPQVQSIPAAPPPMAPIATAVVVPPQPPAPPPTAVAQPAVAPSNPFAAPPQPANNVVAVKNPVVQPPAQPPRAPSHTTWRPAPPAAHHGGHASGGMVAAKVPQSPPSAPAAKGNQTEEMKLLMDATKESGNSLGGSR